MQASCGGRSWDILGNLCACLVHIRRLGQGCPRSVLAMLHFYRPIPTFWNDILQRNLGCPVCAGAGYRETTPRRWSAQTSTGATASFQLQTGAIRVRTKLRKIETNHMALATRKHRKSPASAALFTGPSAPSQLGCRELRHATHDRQMGRAVKSIREVTHASSGMASLPR